jgi:glucose/arabinose dehydrogenase
MIYAARSRIVARSEVMMLIVQYTQNTQARFISTTFVLTEMKIIIVGVDGYLLISHHAAFGRLYRIRSVSSN